MARKLYILATLLFVATGATVWSYVAVLNATSVAIPTLSSAYQSALNFLPANGDITTLNPPQFQWLYVPTFSTLNTDPECKTFVFQCAYDNSFTNPVVNVTTVWNFYNELAPFTNSPVYWRVGYIHGVTQQNGLFIPNTTNSTVYSWSATNAFTIGSSATNWDRSLMANWSFLLGRGHPYMSINSNNQAGAWNWIQTMVSNRLTTNLFATETYDTWIGGSGEQVSNNAVVITNKGYWPNALPNGDITMSQWSSDVLYAAYMWGLTRSTSWSNAHPEIALNVMATNFIVSNLYSVDVIDQAGTNAHAWQEMITLSLGYDLCYGLLNATEKSNISFALGLRCSYTLHNLQFGDPWMVDTTLGYGIGDPTGQYSDPASRSISATYGMASQADLGSSHGIINQYASALCALAAYQDNAWCSNYLDFTLNYLSGPTYCYRNQMGNGRSYTPSHMAEKSFCYTWPIYCTAFPELGLTNNPFVNRMLDFWDRMEPVASHQMYEPWSDAGGANQDLYSLMSDGWAATILTCQGPWHLAQYQNERNYFSGRYGGIDGLPSPVFLLPYVWYTNTTILTEQTNLFEVLTNEGWAFMETLSPSDMAGYSNGINFFMEARPTGCEGGHTTFADGDFQIWAYGASVTESGEGGVNSPQHVSWEHYSMTINGLGQQQPVGFQWVPQYAYFSAYTNSGTNFDYVRADLTQAYGHTNFGTFARYTTLPASYSALNSAGSLYYVTNVSREVLFCHRQYFVLYDTIACTNSPTNNLSWIYRIPPCTQFTLNGDMSFNYTTTNWLNSASASNVTTYVAFANAPGELTCSNYSGTNYSASTNYMCNPWTGENYANLGVPAVGQPHIANQLWFNNATPTNVFHWMTVIYPASPGTAAPVIRRLTDGTMQITGPGFSDIVSWDKYIGANYRVDYTTTQPYVTSTLISP